VHIQKCIKIPQKERIGNSLCRSAPLLPRMQGYCCIKKKTANRRMKEKMQASNNQLAVTAMLW